MSMPSAEEKTGYQVLNGALCHAQSALITFGREERKTLDATLQLLMRPPSDLQLSREEAQVLLPKCRALQSLLALSARNLAMLEGLAARRGDASCHSDTRRTYPWGR